MFKLFEVKEGKFEVLPSIRAKKVKNFFIVSIVIVAISFLSGWLKIDEKDLWKVYQVLIEKLNLKQDIPEIIDNQKRIDAIVELEVDKALEEVRSEYDRIIAEEDRKYQPRYIEEENDESVCYTEECKSLAPPMRICAPWAEGCEDLTEGK